MSFTNSRKLLGLLLILSSLSACLHSPQEHSDQLKPDLEKAARINVQLGLAYLEKGEVNQAKTKLLLAKSEAPAEASVWSGMGYFLERTGDIQQAERHHLKAISINLNQGPALNNYAAFLCRQGRYQEALATFDSAAKDSQYIRPALAFANAGTCALKIPDQKLANQYFRLALLKDPRMNLK